MSNYEFGTIPPGYHIATPEEMAEIEEREWEEASNHPSYWSAIREDDEE